MKKNTAVKVKSLFYFLFLLISVTKVNAQTSIHSTSVGGDWNSTTTWVGGVVPTINDNVFIDSTVYLNANVACSNLTISPGVYLYNKYGYSVTLSVSGTVTNNGFLKNHWNGYVLMLDIKGNLINNGIWNINSTTLSGTADQIIQQTAGKKFEGYISMTDSIGDVVLGSDIFVDNNTWELNRAKIRTNGHTLKSNSYTLRNGYIVSNDLLLLNESIILNLNFSGNYTLDGKVYSQDGNIFNGTLTVIDTLTNRYGYTNTSKVEGTIVNNGVIVNNPKGYAYSLDIDGDIKNNGIWNVYTTSISGTTDHYIQQSSGKAFQGLVTMTDSIGDLILNSPVMFKGNTFDLNRTKLQTNGFKLQTIDETIRNGYVQSNDTMHLYNSVIEAISFSGNYKLDGKIFSKSGIVFNGNCTVIDTLFNRYAYTNTILIKGNITNKGVIKNNPDGYILLLDIKGNVNNQGIWNVNTTNFIGTANQTIQQSSGKSFEGAINTTDSIGDIILASNVMVKGSTWNMNNAKLRTKGYQLQSTDYTLTNGKIVSREIMLLKNTIINNMQFFGNYSFKGKVFSQNNNVFNDTCTVVDTLYNRYGYTNTILVKGNIINKGIIKNNPDGYILLLDIQGNVNNQGTWNVNTTNFIGTTDQTIQQLAGKSFEGAINTADSIGDIILASNVALKGSTWNMNNARLLTKGYQLQSSNYTLTNGKIISREILSLKNTIINNMQFFGNYSFKGKVLSQDNNVFNDTCTVLDTLYNRYGYTNTIQIKGNIINKGIIKNHPDGYALLLDIKGDVNNRGVWRVNTTNFISTTDQTIQQMAGKSFEGAINTTDSIGDIILGSDVMLESNTWNMNKSKLRTNGHKLSSNNYTLTNGKIISRDTMFLNKSIIESMQLFGNSKLGGKIFSQNNNEFNDTLTVIDTLTNRYGYTNTILINGDLVNKGFIINHPDGYILSMQVKGNISNNRILSISNLYLIGTNPRTISGSNAIGIATNITVDDSIRLVGTNTIPYLSFSSNPKAWCKVDTNATLGLQTLSNPARLLNFGKVYLTQGIDNTIPNTISFFESSISCKVGVTMNKLSIDHYGYQQHPTTDGAVNTWWRLRNSPENFTDSLLYLKLSYRSDALNNNVEDSLKVYHSANAGLKWERIKVGVSIDNVNNIVTVNNAPASGHYILSASSLGITTFHPLVESAEPRFGGNSGQVTLYIYGAGLKKTSYAVLRIAGTANITADTSYLTDATGESMLARFNLKGKAIGAYDVVIKTPGEATLTLPAYFTIKKGVRSAPWVVLTGRDRFLLNRLQTFNLNYGNTANVDARGTVMVFVVNDLPNLEVDFPDTRVMLPKAISDLGANYTRIADSVPLYFTTDTLTGYVGTKMRVYPFYIPVLSAGVTKNARVRVKLNGTGSLIMDAWVVDPFFENINGAKALEPMPAEVRACITAAAMKYYATGVIGLIPGAGCYNFIDKVVDPIGRITPESIKPEDAEGSMQSWFWSSVSWASSITQCATSLMPGIGQATQLGIGIASMIIDSKDNHSTEEGCWRKFKKKSESKMNSRGVTSFDPNEMVGPQGYSTDRYISKEGELNYRIYFENVKTAAASALEVFVKDTIDITSFDLNTFSFNAVTFGDTTINVQKYAKEFTLLVDMFPKKAIIVQAHGKLDTISGEISWSFASLDRVTMELVEDPDQGFLPPNVSSPEGEGSVGFSCLLKEKIAHNTLITNQASIVFDFNQPIVTNTCSNKVDTLAPVSSVDPLGSTSPSNAFDVSWSGSDNGCGISNNYIFVSEGTNPYVLWKVASNNETTASFIGENGKTYSFYSIAADSIGLTEVEKTFAEATTQVIITNVNEIKGNIGGFNISPNPASSSCVLRFELKESDDITISIENGNGVTLQTSKPQRMNAGATLVKMDLQSYSSGMYFVRITGSKTNETHNLLIIK